MHCPRCQKWFDGRSGIKPHCKPGTLVQCVRRDLDFRRVEALSDTELDRIRQELSTDYLTSNPRVDMVRLLAMVLGKAKRRKQVA